jgi:hypothetical protein
VSKGVPLRDLLLSHQWPIPLRRRCGPCPSKPPWPGSSGSAWCRSYSSRRHAVNPVRTLKDQCDRDATDRPVDSPVASPAEARDRRGGEGLVPAASANVESDSRAGAVSARHKSCLEFFMSTAALKVATGPAMVSSVLAFRVETGGRDGSSFIAVRMGLSRWGAR